MEGRRLTTPLAGQFVVLRLRPKPDGSPLFRSYSLSGAPSDTQYRVSVKVEPNGAAGSYLDRNVRTGDVLDVSTDLLQRNADKIKSATQTRLPTSIDNMTPSSRFIQTLATIPVTPQVAAHSIVAVKGSGPVEQGNDGMVEYKSAHIDGVESELVVNSGHSAQGNPHTVEEVRRILLLHAAETCEQTGIACIRPADDNGRSTTISQVQTR